MKRFSTAARLACALGLHSSIPLLGGTTHPAILDSSSLESKGLAMDGGRVERVGDGLRLTSDGTHATFTVTPGEGSWDWSSIAGLKVTLHNRCAAPATVRMTAAEADAKGLSNACSSAIELSPGGEGTLLLRLVRRPENPTFAPFKPFYMYVKAINVRDNTIDPAKVASLRISLNGRALQGGVELSPVVPDGAGTPVPIPFFPFIDGYGQYVHSDWPGKVYTDADFATLREKERQETAASPGPTSWDRFGGWAGGPTLKATGFFYPAKQDGKWWLVDPDGKLFWSYGPTGVGFGGDVSPVTDREKWFASLPPADGPLSAFYVNGHGAMFNYYHDRDWHGLDIQRANLFRKYGPDYKSIVAALSHDRLHSWGFNTMGNWSSSQIYLLHRTPYTVPIGSPYVSTMTGGDGHAFQDVFDPRWEPGLYAEMEKQRGTTAGDPWCIGYFVDNERCIGWRPRGASIGEMALKAGPKQPAKLKFVEQLRAKYDTIKALNKAWKANYESWDALRERNDPPSFKDNPSFLADCGDFGMTFCERYFSVAQAAVKKVAPNNLFLGTRFYGHTDPEVVALAAKYMDVISYNIYDNPPDGRVNQYAKIDKPLMSTEWGILSDSTQTPFRDEKLTAQTPAERAAIMQRYVEHALKLPNLVGAHFFQFRDQPLSGRPDGEATLRGFVNVADTPNFSLVAANRAVSYRLYETRSGK